MANSETNYKLTVTSIELKAPQEFANDWTTTTIAIDNGYRFEQLAKTQSKIEANITRTMYHSQTIFKIDTTGTIVPFFELIGTTTDLYKTIGRIVLKITFSGDESVDTLTLVGTSLTASNQNGSLVSNVDVNNSFTEEYTSIFKLKGAKGTNTTLKWIIDFNKNFKINQDRYMTLGLKYTGNSSTIRINSYTEVIS